MTLSPEKEKLLDLHSEREPLRKPPSDQDNLTQDQRSTNAATEKLPDLLGAYRKPKPTDVLRINNTVNRMTKEQPLDREALLESDREDFRKSL